VNWRDLITDNPILWREAGLRRRWRSPLVIAAALVIAAMFPPLLGLQLPLGVPRVWEDLVRIALWAIAWGHVLWRCARAWARERSDEERVTPLTASQILVGRTLLWTVPYLVPIAILLVLPVIEAVVIGLFRDREHFMWSLRFWDSDLLNALLVFGLGLLLFSLALTTGLTLRLRVPVLGVVLSMIVTFFLLTIFKWLDIIEDVFRWDWLDPVSDLQHHHTTLIWALTALLWWRLSCRVARLLESR
jgi:hypothetical protein